MGALEASLLTYPDETDSVDQEVVATAPISKSSA
jgi:hypothetical protein